MLRVPCFRGVEAGVKRCHSRCGLSFDIDVNEDEPFLINSRQEILNQGNVAARDLARGIETIEIMQRVGAVTKHWGTAQRLSDAIPRYGKTGREDLGGSRTTPHIRVSE